MNNEKFKVGDRVRIINCSCIEHYELNEIGVIVEIRDPSGKYTRYVVDMGRPRRVDEPKKTCWHLFKSAIELVNRPKQQMLFNFMY